MTRDRALIAGIVGLLGCMLGLLLAPREALIAWLVAWLAWGAIPIGALALLMLLSLIPGTWREFYARPIAIGASLMPLVAIAMIPLLAGMALIYPWTDPSVTADYAAFKGAWLSTGFFVARTIVYLLILCAFAWGLLTCEPRLRGPIAAVGVLVTALLMWGYMHAMQYIVIWAGDIPEEVRWYLERGHGGWGALAWILYGLQGLVTFAALLSPSVRNSRTAMMGVAALTLAMRLAESSWFILPGIAGIGWAVAPLILAASLAMFGFGWVGAVMLRRENGWNESEWVRQTRSAP
jgi:hypothetical protein